MTDLAIIWPAILAAFSASFVEAVEAFTIVLAVSSFRGWRPAVTGAVAGLATLAIIVALLGNLLDRVPLHALQVLIGVLLILFGTRWMRKAILRSAGIIELHDETAAFAAGTADLERLAARTRSLSWIAGLTAFKAVLLEGIEVVFVVVAVGADRGMIWPASIGALAACLLVLLIGLAIRKPLAAVPENPLKFGVGVMLSTFGVYWTGEGFGIPWPGHDLAIVAIAGLFLITGWGLIAILRQNSSGATR